MGCYYQAREQFRLALAADPQFPPTLLTLAEWALKHGDWANALALAERVRALGEPGDIEAERLIAQVAILRGDYAGARDRLTAALAKHPNAAPLLIALSHAWLRQGGHDREAKAALRAVLGVAPDHAESKQNLDVLLRRAEGEPR